MSSQAPIPKQLLLAVQSQIALKDYLHQLIKQLKTQHDESLPLLKETMAGLCSILKSASIHPTTKFNTHKMIMHLVMLADLDVYEEFLKTVYIILKGNCLYNRNMALNLRGEEYFKKSKYYVDGNATQKQQIKRVGALYIIFSLETVYEMAKWLPFDLEDDTKPTKFSTTYQSLKKEGVQFPKEENFKFYTNFQTDEIQKAIREIQKQFSSIMGSDIKTNSIRQLQILSNQMKLNSEIRKLNKNGSGKLSRLYYNQPNIDMETKNKIFLLEDQNKKLTNQIEVQRAFFQKQLQRQKKVHEQNILKYQTKITALQQEIQKMRQKINMISSKTVIQNKDSPSNFHSVLASGSFSDKNKDKIIEELQSANKLLNSKVKNLQESIKNNQQNVYLSKSKSQSGLQTSQISVQMQKLKKQNISLKAKLLTQCSQASEFSNKKNSKKSEYINKQSEGLNFLGYEDSRSCFEPFYSNSSTQIKVRLRKAIIREKQLLYRDKTIQVGCITKMETPNSLRMIIVFTNISSKPLFNFSIDFVSRQDLLVQVTQNSKNYLQISGQNKAQITVVVNQINFRCLLCSLKFNAEGQQQKIALILPVSKLKFAQQLVFTPISKKQRLKKVEKVFQSDKKILPNIHKFKQYFDKAILQKDRTQHEVYFLKIQFMGHKFYIECDQIEAQLRVAVKFYQDEQYAVAEKLLEEFTFLFIKN